MVKYTAISARHTRINHEAESFSKALPEQTDASYQSNRQGGRYCVAQGLSVVDLNLDRPGDHNYIRSLSQHGVMIGDEIYTGPILVSAQHIRTNWPPQTMDELQEAHLQVIYELKPEVVLLGTGARHVFLPPRLMVAFCQKDIGIEAMSTEAACRTFNVLVSESRNVVAALMPK